MLDMQAALAAETAADLWRQCPYACHRDRQPFGGALLYKVHRLARRPDRKPAAAIDFGKRAAWLHIHMMLSRRVENVLDYDITL